MIIYKKRQMENLISSVITIVFLLLGMCVSANAQENIKVYNQNEEVILSHELFYYNEQYYLCLDDLQQLGLDVTEEENKYTITSSDCLGEERTLVISPFTIGTGDIITQVNASVTSDESKMVDDMTCSISYKCRSTQTIGYTTDSIFLPADDTSIGGHKGIMIKVDGELYISAQYVGSKLSHKYSLENGRMDFYIADDSAVIMETTVNLVKGIVAPLGGQNVKIYTAYKSGEGNTVDDFEMLSSFECTIAENESSAACLIETPVEKITNGNIYFIVDLGERYALSYSEYDFSKVGKVLVYGQQKDVTYTVDINLPEINERDIPFTVYVEADNNTYSKQGVVKSGEKTVEFQFEGLPVAERYKTKIGFDYHKYKNAILEDFQFLNIAYAKDFKTEFAAQYSREVVCTVSLPEDFVPDGDVEIKVSLARYVQSGSLVVWDEFTDWTDSRIVTLNNEKRSEEICLYSQASSSKLFYGIISDTDGLSTKGYLHTGGKMTSNGDSAMKIAENMVVDIPLLRQKNIKVNVFRPFALSLENDVFLKVILDDISTSLNNDVVMDYTQTPLILSGERKAQIELKIAEDEIYTLKLDNITGDDRLFDYYSYVKYPDLPSDSGKKGRIGFSDDNIDITLLQCNNIAGTITSEKQDLDFDVLATCKLYNGNTIYLTPHVSDRKFNLKIPEDTDIYMLDVQTKIGKKSYYVTDGVSSNNQEDATEFVFEYDDDKSIVLEYIVQNPAQPIEISTQTKYDYFRIKNVSDYTIEEYDAYVAYYDKQGRMISVDKTECNQLISGMYYKLSRNIEDYKIKKVKAFSWERDGLTPLGNVSEINVNQPDTPKQDISVFKVGNSNAVINCKEIILSKAPEVINATMYISSTDFEKLGYRIFTEETDVCIEKDGIEYKFASGEYTAICTEDNIIYEISAPVLLDDEILIPVSVVSNLFGENAGFHNAGNIVIINMPFYDIEYTDLYCEAILDMYSKGVVVGYEDGSFQPEQTVYRSEATVYFARTMGHEFLDYNFTCSDVPSDHWAKSWIGICINEKVFELENNKFCPDELLTVEDAIIAALKMQGKYSEDYLDMTKTNGLLTNIAIENLERNITRVEMVQLLYNATK